MSLVNVIPIKAITRVPDIRKFGTDLKKRFRAAMREAHKEASQAAKDILKSSIRLTDSVATGKLINSVSARLVRSPNVDGYVSNVGFRKPGKDYAYFANYGRSSGGFPPTKVMLRWARARGIDEKAIYPISKKIAEEGTKGHYFMEDAKPKIEKSTNNIIRKAVRNFDRSK